MSKKLVKNILLSLCLGLGATFTGCGTETSNTSSDSGKEADTDKHGGPSSSCKHGTADEATGKCAQCEINWSGDNCDECADGFSGSDCHWVKPAFGTFKDARTVVHDVTTGKDEIVADTYKTIQIGRQIWYAENARFTYQVNCHTSFSDNGWDGMDKITSNWLEEYYTFAHYGCYYEYEDIQKVCNTAEGWRLPTKDDYDQLLAFADKFKSGDNVAAALIVNADDWYYNDDRAANEFGFGLYPGGYLSGIHIDRAYYQATLWTATNDGDNNFTFGCWIDRNMKYWYCKTYSIVPHASIPARCVKDAD